MSSGSSVSNPEDEHHYGDSLFPHANANGLNKTFMLTGAVSLVLLIVIIIAVPLCGGRILRRQARRRASMHQVGLTETGPGAGEQPMRGLAPTVIASLPVFLFRHSDGEDDTASATECLVCLSTMENDEMARLLPNCKHVFHAECIDKWLSSHSTCPICRTDVEPPVQPEPREAPAGPAGGGAPAALPQIISGLPCMEGSSRDTERVSDSSSRLNSFRRILGREKSSRRIHFSNEVNVTADLERQ